MAAFGKFVPYYCLIFVLFVLLCGGYHSGNNDATNDLHDDTDDCGQHGQHQDNDGCRTHSMRYLHATKGGGDRIHSPLDIPDIFLIGMAKCGTTSLFSLLIRHGQICSETIKEVHYFDSKDNWRRGSDWYSEILLHHLPGSCSPESLGNKFTIDGSPAFEIDRAAAHISASYTRDSLRKKKFILILRDPIAREISWYKHKYLRCQSNLHEVLASTNHSEYQRQLSSGHHGDACDLGRASWMCRKVGCSHVSTHNVTALAHPASFLYSFEEYFLHDGINMNDGRYFDHVKQWLKYVHREQLFIIHLDTLTINTTDTANRLAMFLGLNSSWGGNVSFPWHNAKSLAKEALMSCSVFDTLYEYYRAANEGLEAFINSRKALHEPMFPLLEYDRRICY